MRSDPTLWSSLNEHITIARKLRSLKIQLQVELCVGTWQCYEVCPIGCWGPDYKNRKVILYGSERCIACGACVLQCPEEAIRLH